MQGIQSGFDGKGQLKWHRQQFILDPSCTASPSHNCSRIWRKPPSANGWSAAARPWAKGQPLCELITEKTTLELPAEVEGIVRQIVAPDKAVVPTGFVIALIGAAAEELPDIDAENAALSALPTLAPSPLAAPAPLASPAPLAAPARQDIAAPLVSSAGGGRLRATPAARRAAKVAGVALEAVALHFPDKVLSEDDIKAFASGEAR